jgi:hypothetical protein
MDRDLDDDEHRSREQLEELSCGKNSMRYITTHLCSLATCAAQCVCGALPPTSAFRGTAMHHNAPRCQCLHVHTQGLRHPQVT